MRLGCSNSPTATKYEQTGSEPESLSVFVLEYNPGYNLGRMKKRFHRAKLRSGGTMNVIPNRFEIRVRGQLGKEWTDWFEGLELRPLEDGEMILNGSIPDQAALMGILNKLHRLNLTILSLNSAKEE